MTKIDLLYLTHQRREFVEETYAALHANTDWSQVANLHLVDDDSTDGTQHYNWFTPPPKPTVTLVSRRSLGGPVAAMNHMLDRTKADVIAKIDSDVIVCPGWLEQMLAVLDANPELDCLGMEPGFGGNVAPPDAPRSYVPARWIGGVGLIRTRVFARRRPVQTDRYFGWTAFQKRHCRCGWISPALPVFPLDLLPFEPWMSLTDSYIEKGWQRPLHREPGRYDEAMSGFWQWWLDAQGVAACS